MAIITSLSTLKSALADEVNRSDISTSTGGTWEVLIQLAEQRFQRDPRVRDPGNNAVLVSLMTTDPNWLLTAHPDIYFYGTLVECAPYLKDDARIPVWEQRYQDAVSSLSGSVRLDPNRTALALTSYAELQTTAADALNRGDIKNVVPVMIVMAEKSLSNDPRVKNLTSATFAVDADDEAVPTGFRKPDTLYHDGPTYFGPIEIVGPDALGDVKARCGATGVPTHAAFINGVVRFAPVPDTSYSLKLTYWQTITALASGTNWLYTNHPHIYLRATLAEARPWVQGDPGALAVCDWAAAKLEQDLDNLALEVWDRQFSGFMRRQYRAIGD